MHRSLSSAVAQLILVRSMNTRFIASNLKEAEGELRDLITRIDSGEPLSFEDYHVAMAHIYHHLNSAWNGRDATDEQWRECTDEDYQKWQKFPHDLSMIGDDDYYDLPEYEAKT
jgi:hypothetical protein